MAPGPEETVAGRAEADSRRVFKKDMVGHVFTHRFEGGREKGLIAKHAAGEPGRTVHLDQALLSQLTELVLDVIRPDKNKAFAPADTL